MMRRVQSRGFLAWPVLLAMLCSPIALFARPISSRSANSRCPRISRAARAAGTVVSLDDAHLLDHELNADEAGFESSPVRGDLPEGFAGFSPVPVSSGTVFSRGDIDPFLAYLLSLTSRGPPGLALAPQS
jgi:hypothetical protein